MDCGSSTFDSKMPTLYAPPLRKQSQLNLPSNCNVKSCTVKPGIVTLFPETPALNALRQATRLVHHELERDLHIASTDAGREEYLAYAAALWGWLSSFEQNLWNAIWPPEMAAMQRAGKCEWLMLDLRTGGMSETDIARLPVSAFQPDMESLPARFGAAYVIEGAQLGTQVLRKRLGPKIEPWTPRWLEGYSGSTAAQWRLFIACLEHTLDSEQSRTAAARSAHETFCSLAAWFRMQSVA